MITHVIGITGASAFIVLCTVLPFLPGRYDSLAAPLSMVSQLFGRAGLLLVPAGAVWIAAERPNRNARTRHVFRIAVLSATFVLCALMSFAVVVESFTLGMGAIVLWGYLGSRLVAHRKWLDGMASATATALASYLIIVPIAVALAQGLLARPVSEFTRSRAIRNSAALIADIEQYWARNGRYPLSLLAVNKDYSPSIIGIKEFLYEPSGNSYNLMFEQPTFILGTREFVVYNPRNEHAITSHAIDRLQLSPQRRQLAGGHYAVHQAAYPNWKFFWFD